MKKQGIKKNCPLDEGGGLHREGFKTNININRAND